MERVVLRSKVLEIGACGEDWVEVKDAGWQVDRSLVANNPHIAEVGSESVDWGGSVTVRAQNRHTSSVYVVHNFLRVC